MTKDFLGWPVKIVAGEMRSNAKWIFGPPVSIGEHLMSEPLDADPRPAGGHAVSEENMIGRTLTTLAKMGDAYERMCLGSSPTGNYSLGCSPSEALDATRAAHSLIRKLPVWIPVSERLPAKGTRALVFTEGCRDESYHVASVDEYGEWFPSAGDGYGFPTVTHWMPLPPPLKEKP
jgi:hypothetical protein